MALIYHMLVTDAGSTNIKQRILFTAAPAKHLPITQYLYFVKLLCDTWLILLCEVKLSFTGPFVRLAVSMGFCQQILQLRHMGLQLSGVADQELQTNICWSELTKQQIFLFQW